MSKWLYCSLREKYGPLQVGTEVFIRRMTTRRPLAVGPCWWMRPRSDPHFFLIAESFGGEELFNLVSRKRDSSNRVISSPDDCTNRLNQELRSWLSRIHPMARPSASPLVNRKFHVNL